MADKKFGLSDALINAVRQVAENSAPLPRDERERDLARQARSNPKSLDEGVDLIQESDEIPTPFSSAKQVLALGKATREQLAAAHNARKKEHIKAYSELWNTGNHEGKAGQLHLDKANMHSELANMYRDPEDHFENEKRKRAEGVYSGSGVTVHKEEAAAPKKKLNGGISGGEDPLLDVVVGAGNFLAKKLGKGIVAGVKKIVGKEEFQVGNTSDVYFYEKLSGEQFKIARAAPPEGEITKHDFEELRKKKKMKEEAELVSEASGMTHIGYVDDDKASEFYRHMEMGNESFVAERHGEKHIPGKIAIYTSNPESANHVKKFPHFQENKIKEETDLDEAKLSPEDRERYQNRKLGLKPEMTPAEIEKAKKTAEEKRRKQQKRRDLMSRAARAARGANLPKPKKPQAYVSPDKPKGAENETPNDDTRDPRENIINQLRKQPVEGKHTITFRNGKTHLLSPAIVNKARTLHANMHPSKKGDFQERLAASLESFQDAVKNPENEAPKPKGKEALLAPPKMPDYKTFAKNLARVARGGPPKSRER